MIAGVLSIVDFFISGLSWVDGLPAVAAVIMSSIAIARIRRSDAGGLGLAITGLVTGVVGLVFFLLAVVGLIILMVASEK